jgi:hypothetical protein
MEISIQHLVTSYCQELNQSWVQHAGQLTKHQVNYDALKPIIEKFREAERDGYEFELVYCPLQLINKAMLESGFESEMMQSESWEDINVINRMKEESRKNNWVPIDAPLDRLRIEKIKLIAGQFLQDYVMKNGAFFIAQNLSTILVFCMMGSIAHEIALISILQSKLIEDGKSKPF